jgi:hypothetical protein
MEQPTTPSSGKTRDTFAIIHDDEFQPLNSGDLESGTFQHDVLDWQDSWKEKPAHEVFRNQIRLAPNCSDHPKD